VLVVKVVPAVVFALGERHVVPTRQRPVMHRQREQPVVGTTAQTGIHVLQTELGHVQVGAEARILLNLSKVAVETLDVEN